MPATVAVLVPLAAGALLVALGLFCALVPPRTPTHRAVACTLVFSGLFFALQASRSRADLAPGLLAAHWWAEGVVLLGISAGFVGVSLLAPDRLERRRWGRLALPALAGLVVVLVGGWVAWKSTFAVAPDPWSAASLGWTFFALSNELGLALTVATLYVFAQRLAMVSEDKKGSLDRHRIVVLASALLLYPGFFAGNGVFSPWALDVANAYLVLALLAPLAVLFLVRGGEAVAVLGVLSVATGLGAVLALGGYDRAVTLVGYGVSIIVSGLVVTYAILKPDVLEFDLTLHRTIQKGTLIAVLSAIGLAIAKAAQQWLDQSQDLLLGAVAAALLPLVLPVLERFASGVARKAVPTAAPRAPREERKERAYKEGVKAVLLGGKVPTREQERALAEMGRDLGLDTVGALRLREEAEGEIAAPLVRVQAPPGA